MVPWDPLTPLPDQRDKRQPKSSALYKAGKGQQRAGIPARSRRQAAAPSGVG